MASSIDGWFMVMHRLSSRGIAGSRWQFRDSSPAIIGASTLPDRAEAPRNSLVVGKSDLLSFSLSGRSKSMTRRRLIELQGDKRKDSSISCAESSLVVSANGARSVVLQGAMGKWQDSTLHSTIFQTPRWLQSAGEMVAAGTAVRTSRLGHLVRRVKTRKI
jgi:hypothetical protein